MARPNIEKVKKTVDLVLTEVFDKVTPTEYKKINYSDYTEFQFQTKLGNPYSLEFHPIELEPNIVFDSNKKIIEYFPKLEYITANAIAFTTENIIDKEDSFEFEKETNNFEQFDLFSRIVYICKNEITKIKNNDVFIIGFSKRNKNDIYYKLIENHFKNIFNVEYGNTDYFPNGKSLFLIKKSKYNAMSN